MAADEPLDEPPEETPDGEAPSDQSQLLIPWGEPVPGDDEDESGERLSRLISLLTGDQPVVRGELGQILRQVQISERHSGPLPHPSMLREYNEIIPDGAERIMRMAEVEQSHRHSLEMQEQGLIETNEGHDYVITRRGQTFGLATVIGVLVMALILAAMDKTALATVLVSLDLVTLAAVFVAGRYLPGRAQRGPDDSEGIVHIETPSDE